MMTPEEEKIFMADEPYDPRHRGRGGPGRVEGDKK